MTEMSTLTGRATQHIHRDDAKLAKDAASLLNIIRGRTAKGVFDFSDDTAAFAIEAFYKAGRADSALADTTRAFLEPYKDASEDSLKHVAGASATARTEVCLTRDGAFAGTLPMSPHVASQILAFRRIIERAT